MLDGVFNITLNRNTCPKGSLVARTLKYWQPAVLCKEYDWSPWDPCRV